MIASPSERGRNRLVRFFPLAVLVAVIAIAIVVRIRLLDAPLERDEGEHAYLGQTMLEGYAPWQLAYNMKLPGTDAVYALSMAIFGQTASAIRLGLLLFNLATIVLVFLLGRRLFGDVGGAAAGAAYGILSFGQGVFGTIAHSTHYVAFFGVLGTWLLLRAGTSTPGTFLSGLVYGLAFLMKQPGLCFAAFGASYILWLGWEAGGSRSGTLRRIGTFSAAVFLPYALLCLGLWQAGTFSRFWFWTVTLTRAFASQFSHADRAGHFRHVFPIVIGADVFIWVLGGVGLLTAWWNRRTRRPAVFVAALLFFSFLGVSLAGGFNPSYFIPMLPAVALAVGGWAACMTTAQRAEHDHASAGDLGAIASGVPFLVLTVVFAFSILSQKTYLFGMSPFEFSRNTYGLNPFPEAIRIADYIRSNSSPGARIAVVGSEAEIYFYARRQAATGYLFTYGLMENHQYAESGQQEMIAEIEGARPEFLVLVAVPTSWLMKPTSSRTILNWVQNYTRNHYQPVGVIEMVDEGPARYTWGPLAADYQPVMPAYLTVYQLK